MLLNHPRSTERYIWPLCACRIWRGRRLSCCLETSTIHLCPYCESFSTTTNPLNITRTVAGVKLSYNGSGLIFVCGQGRDLYILPYLRAPVPHNNHCQKCCTSDRALSKMLFLIDLVGHDGCDELIAGCSYHTVLVDTIGCFDA